MLKSHHDSKLSQTGATSLQRLILIYRALGLDCQLSDRDIQTLEKRGTCEGIPFFTERLPEFGKHLEKCIEAGAYSQLSGWPTRNTGFPVFAHDHIAQIFSDLDNPSLASCVYLRHIRQLCYFAYKAQSHEGITDLQLVLAMQKYRKIEFEVLEKVSWDPTLYLASLLAQEIFGSFDWDGLNSGHGPGTVSDKSFSGKYGENQNPSKYSVVNNQLFANEDHVLRDSELVSGWSHSTMFEPQRSQFLCVPKDSRGPRTICREPVVAQYAQQGVRRFMQRKMESHYLTRGKVNFEKQSVNAELALQASKDKELSTMDLSDASDRISLALVERVFDGTQLLDALKCTRSSEVVFPDGSTMKVKKFAPMGSAVCFTTLAFVCWSLLYASFMLIGREDLAVQVYVYGDDIIVPSTCFDQAVMLLEHYGLKVNVGKSFTKSFFRESCGTDAYFGFDVTPVRLRFLFERDFLSGDNNRWESFASTIHQLWRRGLFQTAIQLSSLLPVFPPGSEQDSYISLPSELLGITKRQYFSDVLKLKVKKDGFGRPFVRAKVWNTVTRVGETSESETCFLYRVLFPNIGSGRSLDNAKSFGLVELPRQTHVQKTTKRVYLD